MLIKHILLQGLACTLYRIDRICQAGGYLSHSSSAAKRVHPYIYDMCRRCIPKDVFCFVILLPVVLYLSLITELQPFTAFPLDKARL